MNNIDGRLRLIGIAPVMALILLFSMAGAQSIGSINNVLSLSNLVTNPNPVIAGGNVTISFQLFNSYSQSLSNINIQLQANNQIINVSPSSSYLISSIGSGIYGGLGYNTFTYKLHIPSTLSSGVYTINVVANYQTTYTQSISLPGTSIMPINLYIYGVPKINFNIIPQSPLVPGGTLNFNLATVNTGTDTASNVSVELISGDGFSISGQTQFNLGAIAPGSSVQSYTSAIVASNISSGIHNMTVYVTYKTAAKNYSYYSQVPINIATGSPNVVVSIASAMPQQLYPGSNQTLSLLIQNTGTGVAKNLTVSFLSNKYITVQSSVSTFFIGSLNPGSSISENIFVSANSTSSRPDSFIPVAMAYYTSNYGTRSNLTGRLPINVAPSAVFQVVSANDSLLPGSAYGAMTLKIKNIGNQAASDVSISLQSIYPITPVAGNAYISYMAPGNITTVTFYVNVDQNGLQGQYPITLYEQWRQSNAGINQVFSSSNNYYASVYSNSQSGGGNATPYIAGAIVIIICFVGARFLMKRMGAKGEKGAKAKAKQ